jgi:hypothetical protein
MGNAKNGGQVEAKSVKGSSKSSIFAALTEVIVGLRDRLTAFDNIFSQVPVRTIVLLIACTTVTTVICLLT